jgi:hypothetical protein
VHPFQDTNGRTGRLLDAYLLWVTFRMVGEDAQSSPIIVPFPSEASEDDYYDGLVDADNHRPDRLRRYYMQRIEEALSAHRKIASEPPES